MKRHGFTLAELVIVIALSSVVLLAITAMVLSISGYSRARSAELDAKNEVALFETRLGAWFSGFDKSTVSEPKMSKDGTMLSFQIAGEGTSSATFNKGTKQLTLRKTDGNEETFSFPHLSDVTFSKSTDEGADPGLVKCTITYQVDEKTRTYTFLLLKHSANATA